MFGGGGGSGSGGGGFFSNNGGGGSGGGGFFSNRDNGRGVGGGGGFFNNSGGGGSGGGGFFNNGGGNGGGGFFNNNGGGNNGGNNGGGFFSNNNRGGGGYGYNQGPGSGWFGNSNNANPFANMPVFVCPQNIIGGPASYPAYKTMHFEEEIKGLPILPEEKQLLVKLQSLPDEERKKLIDELEFERDVREIARDGMIQYSKTQEKMNEIYDFKYNRGGPVHIGYANGYSHIPNRVTHAKSSNRSNFQPRASQMIPTAQNLRTQLLDRSMIDADTIKCKVKLSFLNHEWEFESRANKSISCKDYRESVLRKWNQENSPVDLHAAMNNSQLFVNSIPCEDFRKLNYMADGGTSADILVQVNLPLPKSSISRRPEFENKHNENSKTTRATLSNTSTVTRQMGSLSKIKIPDFFSKPDFRPKLTDQSMNTSPSMDDLNRMTHDQLSAVNDFKMSNSYGMIEFEEPVDLTFTDLDKAVVLGKSEVMIYPTDFYDAEERPLAGDKLNRQAIITLYGIKSNLNDPQGDSIRVKRKLEDWGAKHISYNTATGDLKFRMFCF